MSDSLRSVLAFGVWGSISAAVVLGAYLLVQAVTDLPRRRRFLLLAGAMGYLVLLDFIHSSSNFSHLWYEWLRLLWMVAYAGSVLYLLDVPAKIIAAATISLLVIGFGSYYGINPLMATTIMFPVGYGVVSLAHARCYLKSRGYGSAILSAYSAALALCCASYYKIVSTGNPKALILGYGQYAEACFMVVLFGWVHLPRELRGRSPVRTPLPLAAGLFLSVLGTQAAVGISLFRLPEGVPALFLGSIAFQIAATLVVYFHRRHQLVIHADNIGLLLEERTAALRKAQEELAKRNAIQAELLTEQDKDLRIKAEVIERQRRLELAAQTAGQAAHDIQNAISPVLARLDELEHSPAGPQVQDSVQRMRQQVRRLLDLNGQMLSLSRRGRGEFHPVRLRELIAEAKDAFPGQPVRIEAAEDVWIDGSWSQLFRAVSNLIANGLEAKTGSVASVSIRYGSSAVTEPRRCHLGFLKPGRYSWIQVEDDGQGIAPEIVDKVFEPFFSSKNGRQKSGSGLGLTIVSAVVDDHRGVLDLETRPGRTCFTLHFPAIEAPTAVVDEATLSGSATVLVIDDDKAVRDPTSALLENAGYSVLAAEDGPQAIRMLQFHDIDVALLDLNLPGMTGLETFLGALHLRPGLRVITHSSYRTSEDSGKLQAAGVSEFLQKPAGRVQILQAIHRVLKDRNGSVLTRPS
jgi:signal transduction histidine kinase/ActR/RegA family two-component response regulator